MPSPNTRDDWAATLMVSGLSCECSQGFVFVTFEVDSGVSEARRQLNGYRFKGCTFDVRPAR
ncbi:hypothetical protein HYFRA_00013058 [Hymenoscyphus fraxineus]|uniref:RRM domain-containing protein n=1 Tax=Hymenoscyphus fraxineus TaxID=746836 RepID=A0A9N9PXW4_9HELO|nr:hypothetical protein HYFRA_00013058 [Hymenoscyphus fraxineus]